MVPLTHRRGTTKEIPLFDIRLDNDVLTFRGSAYEGHGALLKGHLALSIHTETTVRSITMTLQGIRRINLMGLKTEEIVYTKEWTMLDGGRNGFTMAAKNYTYDFSDTLEGSLPESLEGLQGGTHVIYRLKARIIRGMFAHPITAKRHIRIIRTLPPEALELSQTMLVENIWPDKMKYSISTPAKAVVFGTYIPIDVVLLPHLKGLRVGKITCGLKQTVMLVGRTSQPDLKSDTSVGTTQIFEPAAVEDAEEELGRWELHDFFILPKSLTDCVQHCTMSNIKIRHKLHFTVTLHNPDKHISELRASLPVQLFIAPGPSTVQPLDFLSYVNAPPAYDDHYLDRLYGSLGPYDTPTASGATTPNVLSRTNSPEPPSSGENTSTEDLGRVPSYNTALRAGVMGLDGEVAPAYDGPDQGGERQLFGGEHSIRSIGTSSALRVR